jgi:nicotinate-nucleotide--dimethylbenzimidazole phosphoribosyltransferase
VSFGNYEIQRVSHALQQELRLKIDNKTKPLGALGRLEEIALRVGLIQNTLSPRLQRPVLMVFAADHGIAEEGVSPYPQSVTQQMVLNFLQGGAASNVFARQHTIAMCVIDAGVNHDFDAHPALISAKIGRGTQSFLREPAMTLEQCQQAIEAGASLAREQLAKGTNVFAFGEMGIGNTSSAAALMSVLLGIPVGQCVGRGAGLDDAGLQRKRVIIERAIAKHAVADNVLGTLATFGGFEIAMIVGAMLSAAAARAVILIDGFIVSSALLVASRLDRAVLDYCIFTHQSDELGHARLLQHFEASALMHLDMRLGEGTGAVVAYPLLVSAVNFLNEMASFDSAGVSRAVPT